MAPPPYRRPGFSRRAQYSLFAGYVAAIGGICLGLLLVVTARFDPEGHAAIQSLVADLTSPIGTLGRQALTLGGAATDGVAAYLDAGSKNQVMAARIRRDRMAMITAQAIWHENHRLRRLARLVESRSDTIASARLIASSGASSRRYATLSAGASNGVRSGQPVRTSEGLVGRIVATGRVTARVLMITDGGNVVPVQRSTDGVPALATGRGDGLLTVRALQAGTNPFRQGDVFVTSGAGGIYPPNIPVAVGSAANREMIAARPLADPSRFDFAIVEPAFVPPDAALMPADTH